MSQGGEFLGLLASDLSAAAIDQLVTRSGLWFRNSLIHLLAPFVGTVLWFHFSRFRVGLTALVIVYVGLQFVQLASPGRLSLLLIDGAFDLACLAVGIAAAWWLAMRDVPR